MTFDDILGEINDIKSLQRVVVDVRQRLNRQYGQGHWRKLKGFADVQYPDGSVWYTEVHWYETHGIGHLEPKDKRRIRRIA